MSAPAKVKICGIRTPQALDAALSGGADFVGFVFFPRSPRNVRPAEAARLAAPARGRAAIVALLVDPDDLLLEDVIPALKPDLLQLHGHEGPERVAAIKARHGIAVMKAISVETAADIAGAGDYAGIADRILFDAKAPKELTGALPGGNGLSFDWQLLAGASGKIEFMLSGGLSPDNVAAAIALTGAWAVDVSSGVESAPGVKDAALIARFLRAAKKAG
ncbi:MAG: phosphoribosylanthranilate isomerase [Hyphomicrobiaceae bacterium]